MGVHANNNWLTGCDVYNIRHGYLIQTRARNNLIEYCTGSNAHTSNNGAGDIVDFHGEQEYRNEVRFCKLHDSIAGIGMAEWSPGTTGSHEWSGESNYVHDNVNDGIRCDLGETYRVQILGNKLAANGGYGIYLAENSTEYNAVGNKTAGQVNGKRVYRGSSDGTYVAGD